MRNRLRLTLGLVLVCGLALAISACGGDSSDGDTSGAQVDPADLTGTVKVWDIIYGSFPGYEPVADELDAAFEKKYPNVSVEHVGQPFETYNQLYKAAFAARQGPDVMMMIGGARGVLSYAPGLEVLNDRIPPEMQEKLTGWDTVTPGYVNDGDHYGVPMVTNGILFYYNKDMFEEAGLPREFQPKTWEELKQAGEKLEAAGIQAFTGGDQEGYENFAWFSMGWQTVNTQEESVELSEGKMPYTDPAVAEAFEPMIMMQEAGLYPEDRFTTPLYPDGAARLGEKKGAIAMGAFALVGYYNEYIPELGVENVGMFQPPGSTYIGTEPNWVWSMPKFAKNKDAAWAYIEFMASRPGMQMLVDKLRGELPNRDDVSVPADSPPQTFEILETLRSSDTFSQANNQIPPAPYEVLTTEISQVLQGRTTLADAQEAMQEAAEKAGS